MQIKSIPIKRQMGEGCKVVSNVTTKTCRRLLRDTKEENAEPGVL